MKKSEQCQTENNNSDNRIKNNNNDFTDISKSDSDPIPTLFIPMKKLKKNESPISYIISKLQNMNLNSNQIQILAKNKISSFLINKNLQKHNSTPQEKNIMLINDLIESKETHFIAIFKDYLISDYQEEFLRRYFIITEINEVMPKFYQYYKNYLNFFCKGTFSDFDVNQIMQEFGECQAEFYYNRNYGHKDRMQKKEKKDDDGEGEDNNGRNNNEDYNYDNNNDNNFNIFKSIFTKSIEDSIERVKNSYKLAQEEKKQDLSNIKPYTSSKENTIALPDNSSVSYNDIITKENSIRYMIDLMNKKKQRINLNKRIKNKKKEIHKNNIDDKNKNSNNNNKNRINSNKKYIRTLSKTTSNLNLKNPKKNNINKSRNKSNSIKQNYFTNNNFKNKNMQSISNCKKYIEILTSKPKNKSIEPKKGVVQDEIGMSSLKINKKMSKNIANDILNHLNLFSSNNFSNKKNNNTNNNNNKANSSLFLKNNNPNIDKSNKNLKNYNTIFPLSVSKNSINKTKYNISKKSENKEKKIKSKIKEKESNLNNNKYFYINKNIKKFLRTLKNVSSPRSTRNNNINHNNNNINNNYNSNKSLSNSTISNCNININNNIILSNNYYNNKNNKLNQPQVNSASKKMIDKNIQQKKDYINNHISKNLNSRNNQNDLNRFKTDANMLNSLGNCDHSKSKISKNTGNINQYKSFRKSNNDILFKQKNLDKNKKYDNNNNSHQRNFSLKNIPVTVKNNLNYNSYRVGKLFEECDLNSINKTYKNLYVKRNNNNNNIQQKKIIFDYKRK